jgi:hypothetical protein
VKLVVYEGRFLKIPLKTRMGEKILVLATVDLGRGGRNVARFTKLLFSVARFLNHVNHGRSHRIHHILWNELNF